MAEFRNRTLLTFLPRQLDPAGTVSAQPSHIGNPVLLTGKPEPQTTKADGIPMGRAKMSQRHKTAMAVSGRPLPNTGQSFKAGGRNFPILFDDYTIQDDGIHADSAGFSLKI